MRNWNSVKNLIEIGKNRREKDVAVLGIAIILTNSLFWFAIDLIDFLFCYLSISFSTVVEQLSKSFL